MMDRPTSARGRPISPLPFEGAKLDRASEGGLEYYEQSVDRRNVDTSARESYATVPAPRALAGDASLAMSRSNSSSSMFASLRTPPPPSPSAKYHVSLPLQDSNVSPRSVQDPSNSAAVILEQILASQEEDARLLETIGEDGESQAGTIKFGSSSSLARALLEPVVTSSEAVAELYDHKIESQSPLAPVQSEEVDKTDVKKAVMRAQDIFAPPSNTATSVSASTTPAPTTSLKRNLSTRFIRSDSTSSNLHSPAGLSSLEARLSRPASPAPLSVQSKATPPVSPTKHLTAAPDKDLEATSTTTLLAVTPAPAVAVERLRGIGALRSQSISRSHSRSKSISDLASLRAEREKVAISKLADPVQAEVLVVAVPTTAPRVVKKEKVVQVKAKEVVEMRNLPASDPALAAKVTPSTTPVPASAPAPETTDLPVPTATVQKLPAWLSSTSTTKAQRRSTVDFARRAPLPPSTSTAKLSASRSTTSLTKQASVVAREAQLPSVASLLTAETRHALASSPTPLPAVLDKVKPSTGQVEDGPKYDNRSARGGRGGKVFNVASQWADIADPGVEQVFKEGANTPQEKKNARALSPVENRLPTPTSISTALSTTVPSAATTKSPTAVKVSLATLAQPFTNTTLGKPFLSPTAARKTALQSPSTKTTTSSILLPLLAQAKDMPPTNKLSEPGLARPYINTTLGKPVLSSIPPTTTTAGDKKAGNKSEEVNVGQSKVKALLARFSHS